MNETVKTSEAPINEPKKGFLTRNILLLSFISLLTDIASEMLYPIMPLYLKEIGYGVIAIGFLEGFADAFSGLTKGFFGYISDRTSNRNLFIRIGYSISAIAKPIIGLTSNIGVIFGSRMVDRIGKGVRTAPRDAILSLESSVDNRGKVFGFHRSLDTLGAALGPIIALIFLYFFPSDYKKLFLIAFVPGIIAVSLTIFLRARNYDVVSQNVSQVKKTNKNKISFKSFLKQSSPSYRKLLIGLVLLAIVNSSDMFLLLRAKELGMNDTMVVMSYILYNLVFTVCAFPLGVLSDKLGFKKTFLFGLIIFAIVYAGFGKNIGVTALLVLFALYGVFTAAYEAVAKAWLSTYIHGEEQGTGLGLYMSLNSLAFLVASIGTGVIWEIKGATVTFTIISTLSIVVIAYFLLVKFEEVKKV